MADAKFALARAKCRIQKLTPTLGAEILDVDLTQLSDQLIADIRQALLEHVVVFFRDQTLSIEQHKELGRRFGKLHVHFAVKPKIPEHPEILVIETDEKSERQPGDIWHTDASADPEPPLGSILYMHHIPENNGGDTLFASTYAAFDALSEGMKKFLGGLTAIHDGKLTLRQRYGVDADFKSFPVSEHPVIRTHPETKRKCLYVNRSYTSHIPQLKENESAALLEMLFQHMENPLFQCRFKWRKGSIAFWDNRCALHHAVWDYYPARRYAERVTICGDKPV